MSRRVEQNGSMSQYFHGDIRREFIEDLLKDEGDFILRKSSKGSFAISVLWKGTIRHYQSSFNGTTYGFGKEEFKTFDELVSFHWKGGVPMRDESRAVLKRPIKHNKVVFKRADVEILGKLGEGNFGDVFKVKLLAENKVVAMKTLRENVARDTKEGFLKEMDMMATMNHENVVKCVGTVEDTSGEIKILLELVNQGSLDKLIKKGKVTQRGKAKILLQVARGLQYLHYHQIIHRDLAARNILVQKNDDGTITAKVSDFGLSRKDESGKGYELRTAQKLPLKWLAPECFVRRCWTTASDVWSFGILMWEVFTNGKDPYGDMNFSSPQAMSKFIAAGGHPSCLADVDTDMHQVMLSCWTADMEKRPNMDQITQELERIYPNIKNRSTSISEHEHSSQSAPPSSSKQS